MFIVDDRVVYSASDLAAAARCEYALLRAFDAKLGRGPYDIGGHALSETFRIAASENGPR